ncbi:histidine kinase [Georgenia sp. MJ173]|uniref:sensor histidine kinase n=1 Tax=Georgenia sunbinii TaxID=3117728 RepID=UPI002F267DB9
MPVLLPNRPPAARWRPTVWAIIGTTGAMAVLSALALVGQLSSASPDAAPVAVDVVVAVVAVALVPLLFRQPVTAAVPLALLAAVAPTATPAATAGTLVVARTVRFPTAVAVAVLGAAGHVVRGLWRPQPGLSFGWWVVLVLVAHAALLAWGALSQSRTEVLLALAERARRAEADRDLVVAEALAAERARIAREMHDVLAHRLSLLATYAGALEYRPDAAPQDVTRAAGVVRSGVHQALEELRDVVEVLREDPGDGGVPPPAPGIDRLADLVGESRAAGTAVELVVALDGAPTGIVGRTVYRVVQEGLTNARKHAPGSPVRVRIAGAPGSGVEVTVTNPRAAGPADVLPGSGTGLIGLAERVRIVGGRLSHRSDGAEFRLAAWLPWQP